MSDRKGYFAKAIPYLDLNEIDKYSELKFKLVGIDAEDEYNRIVEFELVSSQKR